MRVIVTGTREDTDAGLALAVGERIAKLPDCTVILGGASGVDRWAITFARGLGFGVEIYPAEWNAYGRAAGPIRNQAMVDAGADLCLAFPGGRGTADCVRRCEKAGIPVERIEPMTAPCISCGKPARLVRFRPRAGRKYPEAVVPLCPRDCVPVKRAPKGAK